MMVVGNPQDRNFIPDIAIRLINYGTRIGGFYEAVKALSKELRRILVGATDEEIVYNEPGCKVDPVIRESLIRGADNRPPEECVLFWSILIYVTAMALLEDPSLIDLSYNKVLEAIGECGNEKVELIVDKTLLTAEKVAKKIEDITGCPSFDHRVTCAVLTYIIAPDQFTIEEIADKNKNTIMSSMLIPLHRQHIEKVKKMVAESIREKKIKPSTVVRVEEVGNWYSPGPF